MTSLIQWDSTARQAQALPAVRAIEDAALGQAALVGRVTTPVENDRCAQAQLALKEYLDLVEEARKAVKQPFWDACTNIDTLAGELKKEALEQMTRLSILAGDFQTAEKARLASAENARLRDLSGLEAQREAALAQAPTHEARDAIQASFAQQAASLPKPEAAKAEGQTVGNDWDVTVTDALALANSNRECVKIEPKLREIKAALNAGVKLAGVTAVRITKAGVRRKRGGQGNMQLDI